MDWMYEKIYETMMIPRFGSDQMDKIKVVTLTTEEFDKIIHVIIIVFCNQFWWEDRTSSQLNARM